MKISHDFPAIIGVARKTREKTKDEKPSAEKSPTVSVATSRHSHDPNRNWAIGLRDWRKGDSAVSSRYLFGADFSG